MSFLRLIPHQGLRKWFWWRRVRREIGACGERVELAMNGSYTLPRIFLGNDVHIGSRAIMWARRGRIVVGDKVIMGPEVFIIGGDHDTLLTGKFMKDIPEEAAAQEDGKDIVFETDVWVGARVTILKGVRIGRGVVIGAGSVVTRSVPPYWIIGGNPARPLRLRGTTDEILSHELSLYPPAARLPRQAVEESEARFKAALKLGAPRR